MKNETAGTVDAAAEGNEWTADSGPAADWGTPAADAPADAPPEGEKVESRPPRKEKEPEEEDNTLTLEQYHAQQKDKGSNIPKTQIRKAIEDNGEWKDAVPLTKEEEDAFFVGGKVNTSLFPCCVLADFFVVP